MDNDAWFHLNEISTVCKFLETESRMGLMRSWVYGHGDLFLNKCRISQARWKISRNLL